MNYDALVIGGGPAGSKVAGIIAESGHSVLIVEEHREIGRPIQCSGLVSSEVLRLSGTGKKSVLRRLNEASIILGDSRLHIESKKEMVSVIDRSVFDKEMARDAIRKGADIWSGTRAKSFSRKDGKITAVLNSGGEIKSVSADILIGADGAYSAVARNFGLSRPTETLGAFQAYIADEAEEVKIWPERSASFFSWQIPLPRGSLIGSASAGKTRAADILRRRFPGFEKRAVSIYGGVIPIGYASETVADNVLIVGDAASQVKPLSGGGLYPGLYSAEIAGRIASEALDRRELSAGYLRRYQNLWQSGVGREIKNGLYIRKIYGTMDEKEMKKALNALNNEKLRDIIGNLGDIDHPSALAGPLIKASPKLLIFARNLLGLLS